MSDLLTSIVRPDKTYEGRKIGAIQDGKVFVRFWELDIKSGKFKSVEAAACYCHDHHICYFNYDFPDGCPRCRKETEARAKQAAGVKMQSGIVS